MPCKFNIYAGENNKASSVASLVEKSNHVAVSETTSDSCATTKYDQVVRIRREAFPLRLAYLELYRRFRFLAEWRSGGTPLPDECSEEVSRELCGEICSSALDTEEFQLGKTRVFLK